MITKETKITIVGLGLLGGSYAQGLSNAGYTVYGIDIDPDAVMQAKDNVAASSFASRITICHKNILDFKDSVGFDAIVSNPPYFVDALTCPDHQRTMARHTLSLTYEGLMKSAFRLLKPDGFFSLVIPSENRTLLDKDAYLAGFFFSRVCMIRTTPKKQPKRQLIELIKHPINKIHIEDGIIEVSPNVRSTWYQTLTKDFYIR